MCTTATAKRRRRQAKFDPRYRKQNARAKLARQAPKGKRPQKGTIG